jgi:hypothetical protein
MILIDDYCDETISGNYFTADDGDTQYYDNGRHACTVSLKRLPNTAISDCGNTHGLTTPADGVRVDPKSDGQC